MLDALFFQADLFVQRRAHLMRPFFYGSWLILFACGLIISHNPLAIISGPNSSAPIGAMAIDFVDRFLVQQLILFAVLVPPFMVGAIVDEKTQGTMQNLLLSRLTTREIVLGKLLGRLRLFGLIALVGLPMLAIFAGIARIPLLTILLIALVGVLQLCAIGSLSLLAGVLCKNTRDAVLLVYGVGIGSYCLLSWLGAEGLVFPTLVMAWDWAPSQVVASCVQLLSPLLFWAVVAVLATMVATWRLRPVYLNACEKMPVSTRPTPHPCSRRTDSPPPRGTPFPGWALLQ